MSQRLQDAILIGFLPLLTIAALYSDWIPVNSDVKVYVVFAPVLIVLLVACYFSITRKGDNHGAPSPPQQKAQESDHAK